VEQRASSKGEGYYRIICAACKRGKARFGDTIASICGIRSFRHNAPSDKMEWDKDIGMSFLESS